MTTRPERIREATRRAVGHSHPTDQLPVGRLDDIHNFIAVGFDKSSIDVVRCDCLHGNLPDL
jgi:hypothetical protein